MSDTVQVNTAIHLKAFEVPTQVAILANVDDEGDGLSVALDDISQEALEQLAARWLDNLFASVRRPCPFHRVEKVRAA